MVLIDAARALLPVSQGGNRCTQAAADKRCFKDLKPIQFCTAGIFDASDVLRSSAGCAALVPNHNARPHVLLQPSHLGCAHMGQALQRMLQLLAAGLIAGVLRSGPFAQALLRLHGLGGRTAGKQHCNAATCNAGSSNN
jgi:hypothetical protein